MHSLIFLSQGWHGQVTCCESEAFSVSKSRRDAGMVDSPLLMVQSLDHEKVWSSLIFRRLRAGRSRNHSPSGKFECVLCSVMDDSSHFSHRWRFRYLNQTPRYQNMEGGHITVIPHKRIKIKRTVSQAEIDLQSLITCMHIYIYMFSFCFVTHSLTLSTSRSFVNSGVLSSFLFVLFVFLSVIDYYIQSFIDTCRICSTVGRCRYNTS